MNKRNRISAYAETYLQDYEFESVMVDSRQRLILELMANKQPMKILEAGCGADLLCSKAIRDSLNFDRWITIEPSKNFLDKAQSTYQSDERLVLEEGFFEDQADAVSIKYGPFDLVIVSGLLNEVDGPVEILNAARNAAGPEGMVHVNVPNAYSLHRQLARAMGLIADEHEMGDRNIKLQQNRNYDAASLRRDVESAGLMVEDEGGYLLKPFAHAQMEGLQDLITAEMLDGLWRLGREQPALASEIYINASPKR